MCRFRLRGSGPVLEQGWGSAGRRLLQVNPVRLHHMETTCPPPPGQA